MATLIAPAPLVTGIPRVPLPYGLSSVVNFRDGDSENGHWQNGVRWEAGTCDPADGIGGAFCPPDPPIGLPKDLDANYGGVGEASPFTIYGHFQCSAIGSWDEAQGNANEHLRSREEARAEQALWTGDLGNVPNLAGANGYPEPVVVSGSGAIDVRLAVALLESFIASTYGSLGVIHMGRTVATLAIARGVVDSRGGRLFTELGTPVIAGAGYPGTGPDGTTAPNTLWIYASPALFGYRSDVFTSSNRQGDLLDRANNNLYAIAERTYVLGFDPCPVGAAHVGMPAAPAAGVLNPQMPDPDEPLEMLLGSIPSSPIPDGTDTTIIVQTNVVPENEVILWYSVNGGAAVEAGEMTQTNPHEFIWNVEGSATTTGDSVEVWAVSDWDSAEVESNHITIQVT